MKKIKRDKLLEYGPNKALMKQKNNFGQVLQKVKMLGRSYLGMI